MNFFESVFKVNCFNVFLCVAVVQDVLMNDHIKLDQNFKNSFIGEIIKVC